MNSIIIKNVKKAYSLGKTEVNALRDIDITIEKGEFMVLAGPSGSGKSTYGACKNTYLSLNL